MTVTIRKVGGSVGVIIPKSMAREMDLTDGTPMEISATPGGILLKRRGTRPRRPLSEIVAQMRPASYRNHNREMSQEHPVGREVW